MSALRRILVVSGTRAEYGLLRRTMLAIRACPDLQLVLAVTSMHLSERFGETWREIEADGLPIDHRVPCLGHDDGPAATGAAMARVLAGFSEVYAQDRPDLVLVLGDRFETLAAVTAAAPQGIPVGHIHGGETSRGAVDDLYRHAITKLSHLHFAATARAARIIVAMGEEPWRVHRVGAPAVENARHLDRLGAEELSQQLGVQVDRTTVLACFHPETYSPQTPEEQIAPILQALGRRRGPLIVTAPNADAGGSRILDIVRDFCAQRPDTAFVTSLGHRRYMSVLALAGALVGNSSSGIIEAPIFGLPVVNLGGRQEGRERAGNVLDVANEAGAIADGLDRVLAPGFRTAAAESPNPYDGGATSEKILATILAVDNPHGLLHKAPPDAAKMGDFAR